MSRIKDRSRRRGGYLGVNGDRVVFIYTIRFKGTEHVYCGSTFNWVDRKSKHYSELRDGKHVNSFMQNVFNKYGSESFKFQVEVTVPSEYRIKMEQWFIDRLGTLNLAPYAECVGGQNSKEVRQFDLTGKFVRDFKSIRAAAESCGIRHKEVRLCCERSHRYAGGFMWLYKETAGTEMAPVRLKSKLVNLYDKGQFVRQFESKAAVSRYLRVNSSTVARIPLIKGRFTVEEEFIHHGDPVLNYWTSEENGVILANYIYNGQIHKMELKKAIPFLTDLRKKRLLKNVS